MVTASAMLDLTPEKPAAVLKEPAYGVRPLYGSLRIGSAPQRPYLFAMEETDGEPPRLHLDANRNGDLTDDAAVPWENLGQMRIGEDLRSQFLAMVELEGAWGKDGALRHRCGLELTKIQGRDQLMVFNRAVWTGKIEVQGVERTVAVSEMVEDLGDGASPDNHAPLIMVDLDGDRAYKRPQAAGDGANEIWRLDEVIELDGRRYEARAFELPTQLILVPTIREASHRERPPELLAVGVEAPDFTVEGWQSGPMKLSDLRGRAVIIDFWATWCSACKATMPYVETLYQATADQGVTVLSICTGDTQDKYAAWVSTRTDRYSFKFAFDADDKVAALYNARHLPTKYVIDREGRIVAAFVGGGGPDPRIDRALEQIGIQREARQDSSQPPVPTQHLGASSNASRH
jgi:peroxiredoxin